MPTGQTLKTAIFNLDVPYKVVETGTGKPKPLIIYLHGYKQNLDYFEKKCAELVKLEAYHLFIQGPYPIYDETRNRNVERWGRAWYLYDGEQEQFIRSLEKTSSFIESLVDSLVQEMDVSRKAVLGYSMGGYLAGYFALSRPGYVDDLMVMGGRIKTEHFKDGVYDQLNVLHIHGKEDRSVASGRSRQSCAELKSMGADVIYRELNTGHKLTESYIQAAGEWLQNRGYSQVTQNAF